MTKEVFLSEWREFGIPKSSAVHATFRSTQQALISNPLGDGEKRSASSLLLWLLCIGPLIYACIT